MIGKSKYSVPMQGKTVYMEGGGLFKPHYAGVFTTKTILIVLFN
jgi:hypothetical protein